MWKTIKMNPIYSGVLSIYRYKGSIIDDLPTQQSNEQLNNIHEVNYNKNDFYSIKYFRKLR